jgi:hypothetical protein
MISKGTGILLPYIISLVGVLSDYLTTNFGLGLGLIETNAFYHPILALAIIWGELGVLSLMLPKSRLGDMTKNVVSLASFIGIVNNTLVITGVFSGLTFWRVLI